MSGQVPATAVEIGPLRADECGEVAAFHEGFFGEGRGDGHSIAMLGQRFLQKTFYELNIDNPHFFVDVGRYEGEIIAFSVYCSDHRQVFRHMIRKHPIALAREILFSAVFHPIRTVQKLLGNLAFLSESLPEETNQIRGWFLLLAVKAEYRTREFRARTGVNFTDEFRERLHAVLRERGCDDYWAAPAIENPAAIAFYERIQAVPFAEAPVQGVQCRFYRLSTSPRA